MSILDDTMLFISIPKHCYDVLNRKAAFRNVLNPAIDTTVETLICEAVQEYVKEVERLEEALNPEPQKEDQDRSPAAGISG